MLRHLGRHHRRHAGLPAPRNRDRLARRRPRAQAYLHTVMPARNRLSIAYAEVDPGAGPGRARADRARAAVAAQRRAHRPRLPAPLRGPGTAVNYQRIACWGDSQNLRRTHLRLLSALPRAGAGRAHALRVACAELQQQRPHRARHLVPSGTRAAGTGGRAQACLLIGTNDVGNQTPPALFEYYRQILSALPRI